MNQADGLITFVKKVRDEAQLRQTLGGRVALARSWRGMSQAALAKAAKVAQGTIGNVESGTREKPRELLRIAAALRASPTWLETGRGEWDASESALPEISDDELTFLRNFRLILDEDEKRRIAREVEQHAAKAQTMREKILAEHGLLPHQQVTDEDRRASDPSQAMQYGKRPAGTKRQS